MAQPTADDEHWERLIDVAAEFGLRHPDAVLVGGTVAALYAGHRVALSELDRCYQDIYRPDAERDVSVALQLARQLAEPAPYDLDETDLRSYKRLDPRWQDWAAVRGQLRELAVALTDALTENG